MSILTKRSIALGILAVAFLVTPLMVFAQTPENSLGGYAWSSTIGWVSFSGDTYAVTVGNNGTMSGYAWSSNVGWISFNNSDLNGCPSGTCKAEFNQTTGEVTGWAKALAGEETYSGGWDGWIYLGQSNRVGVSVDNCTWSGYAWGGGQDLSSGIVGWLSFAGPGYSVTGVGNACVEGGDPDLTASPVSVEKEEGDVGATFTGDINNIGAENINGGVDVRMQIAYRIDLGEEYDENYSQNSAVTNIASGSSKEAEFSLDNIQSGLHKVRFCADPDNEIEEADEENNCSEPTTFTIDNGNTGGGLDFSCTVNPGTASVGQEVTWSIQDLEGNVGATTYSWSGDEGLTGSNSTVTKSYGSTGVKTASLTVSATNATKTRTCTGSVNNGGVVITNPPTATLTADDDRFVLGDSTILRWTSNAGSCAAVGGFNTNGQANGNDEIMPSSAGLKTYQINCGSATASENITVLDPNVWIKANDKDELLRVAKNTPVTIEWFAEDFDSCSLTSSNGQLNLTNSTSPWEGTVTNTINERSVYTLTCTVTGASDPYQDSVTINVPPDFEEF